MISFYSTYSEQQSEMYAFAKNTLSYIMKLSSTKCYIIKYRINLKHVRTFEQSVQLSDICAHRTRGPAKQMNNDCMLAPLNRLSQKTEVLQLQKDIKMHGIRNC